MKLRVGIITLGCDKNTVDNEYLAGLLDAGGCELITESTQAPPHGAMPLDAVVVTTCGFIGDAKAQSIDAIVQLADRKRETGNPRRIFVAGCLSQRYGQDLLEEIPEIDGIVGVGQFQKMAEMILAADAAPPRQNAVQAEATVVIYPQLRRRRLENKPHAFLKISDGCNHGCTFCSIPAMKGKHRSVEPEILLNEARMLLSQGVKELNLVAQDLSMYGMDLGKDYRLPQLLRELCALEGDFWIRCLYYYPGNVTDDFLRVMAGEPKIVKYLDMPLQHLDADVLRRMKRPFHELNTFQLVDKLRAAIPGLTLRTTMIVGFPGETDAQHQNMLDGILRLRFDRLGAFQYSKEEDTPAGRMAKHVAKRRKEERWREVMETQASISQELNDLRVGRRERVLLEQYDPEAKFWSARSQGEAPEIDGKVFVEPADGLQSGQFIEVDITSANHYDTFAKRS